MLELRFGDVKRASLDGQLQGLAERVEELPDRTLVYTDDGEAALDEVHRRNIHVQSALVRRASLEDVFLSLTGRSLVE